MTTRRIYGWLGAVWLLAITAGVPVCAQSRLTGWTRATLCAHLAGKWSAEAEGQLRRQNNTDQELMAAPLLYSVRTYVHYDPTKHLRVSLSPFAWFEHYALDNKGKLSKTHEYRLTLAAILGTDIHRHVRLYTRPGLEYRMRPQRADELRPRLQAGVRWQLSPALSVRPFNELFMTYYTGTGRTTFDQNRSGVSLMWHITGQAEAEAGYLHAQRSSSASENIFVNFQYRIGKVR